MSLSYDIYRCYDLPTVILLLGQEMVKQVQPETFIKHSRLKPNRVGKIVLRSWLKLVVLLEVEAADRTIAYPAKGRSHPTTDPRAKTSGS